MMSNFLNKQRGFTLIELMIVITIAGIIASIAVPIYQNYMVNTRWGKTIAGTRALKLAVESCLSDNGGAFDQCDSLDVNKQIIPNGVSAYQSATDDFSSIVLVPSTAAIRITGNSPLVGCILTIYPSYISGMIYWRYNMVSGSSLADNAKCKSYLKGGLA